MQSDSDFDELDDSFGEREAFARLGAVAHDFYFGKFLPRASFPPDFVAAYSALSQNDPVDWDSDRTYFIAHFHRRSVVAMYTMFFSPAAIQSQNRIISQPFDDQPDVVILPPSYYVVGEAFADTAEYRILICLDASSATYGHLFLWRFEGQPPEHGDDSRALAPLASCLEDFWTLLMTSNEAHAALLGSPHLLIESPRLASAVANAARVFAPYRKRTKFRGISEPTGLSEQDLAMLQNLDKQGVEELSGSVLMAYQWSAHDATSEQAQDDIRALLPHIVALIARNDAAVLAHLPMALAKLGPLNWRSTWPDDEVFALDFFGICLFESCLDSHDLGPYWQGVQPQSIRTALYLPEYLALLLNGGLDIDKLIARWVESLAFENVGATLHAASLRFSIKCDAEGVIVDLPGLTGDHRAQLQRLAGFLMEDAEFAMRQRLAKTSVPQERQLIADSLALIPA
jgi:hypothetical protein